MVHHQRGELTSELEGLRQPGGWREDASAGLTVRPRTIARPEGQARWRGVRECDGCAVQNWCTQGCRGAWRPRGGLSGSGRVVRVGARPRTRSPAVRGVWAGGVQNWRAPAAQLVHNSGLGLSAWLLQGSARMAELHGIDPQRPGAGLAAQGPVSGAVRAKGLAIHGLNRVCLPIGCELVAGKLSATPTH